jgi:Tfp pilus assembly protein PilV
MLVATLIMGIAVIGLMSEITASMRNATRVTNRDRAALLARSKMDELLLDPLSRWTLRSKAHSILPSPAAPKAAGAPV